MRASNPSCQTSGQCQGPGSLVCRKRTSTKTESSETSQVFIRREKRVHMDRHMGGLRVPESCPRGSMITYMEHFFLGFLWPTISISLAQSP